MADSFTPPAEVRANAKRGLELRREHGRGGTEVGVARARDLSNGKALPLETINRMSSYFARHEVDKQGEGWGKDSAGYIAWLLWGGDAGRAWVKSILNNEDKKDKAMTTELAYSYAGIIKQEKQADGTIKVYGKATDDSIDIDQQICDEEWLKEAMPHWFKTGGNIREQHSSIAAGVATDYEHKADDGHYITALIVDPVSVKKVEAGVLKGFSIGIRSPRVIRDAKAAGGRIVGGQIVEVSVVDRPANSNAKMTIAKAVDGELVEVAQEFSERPTPASIASAMNKYSDEQERDESGRFGSGGGSSSQQDHDRSVANSRALGAERRANSQAKDNAERTKNTVDRIKQDVAEAREKAEESKASQLDRVNETLDRANDALSQAESARESGNYSGAKEAALGSSMMFREANAGFRSATGSNFYAGFHQNVTESLGRYISGMDMASQAVEDRANLKTTETDLAKYSEDQERDESGRFGSGGGESSSESSGSSGTEISATDGNRMDVQVSSIQNDLAVLRSESGLDNDKVEELENLASAADQATADRDYEKANEHVMEIGRLAAESGRNAPDPTAETRLSNIQNAASRFGMTYGGLTGAGFNQPWAGSRLAPRESTENPDSGKSTTRIDLMSNIEIANKAAGLLAEIKKFDEKMFNNALTAIGGLISVEGKQAAQGHDERESIKDLLKSLKHLIHFYRGEAKEGEVTNPILALLGDDEGSVLPETHPAELLMAAEGDKKNPFAKEGDDEESEKDEPEKDDAGSKEPADEESDDKMDKADMCEKCDKSADECKCADKSVLSDPETAKIIEKAVKSARIAVEEELELLKSANVQLEAERDEALNKAASGGPVRSGLTTKNSKHNVDDLLVKATEYRAKAANTEDRLLSAGYLELADDLESKARKA